MRKHRLNQYTAQVGVPKFQLWQMVLYHSSGFLDTDLSSFTSAGLFLAQKVTTLTAQEAQYQGLL